MLQLAGLLLGLFHSMGCAARPVPMPDMTVGWDIQQGQAVWYPDGESPGIAGELIVATNRTGDFVVEFSNPPLSIVEARRVGSGWAAEYAMEDRSFSGRGIMPRQIIWLHLVPGIRGESAFWNFSRAEGSWKLAHPETGERLEGYFSP